MINDIFTNTCAAVIATVIITLVVKAVSKYFGFIGDFYRKKQDNSAARIADLEHYKKSKKKEPIATQVFIFIKMIHTRSPSDEELNNEIPPLPQEDDD